MAEWLCEIGIGEVRAALIERDIILAAAIEPDGAMHRAGAIVPARLVKVLAPGRRGLARLAGGDEALLEPIPQGVSEGRDLLVEIMREALAEPGRAKRAKAVPAPPGAIEAAGPGLRDRIAADGLPVHLLAPHMPDQLEAAGWSELIEEATGGEIAFPGGGLRLSLTPAMTLFDVDGVLPPADLACAGAAAAARAIRRMGIGGSIGLDLPTLNGKAERAAAAAAFDANLPQPFERTAVNGFGFLQIIRRRRRASLPELLRDAPATAAARALLRRAERTRGPGDRRLVAAPAVIAAIAARPDWVAMVERGTGAPLVLRAEPSLPIQAGHVHAQSSQA
ncbi:MAG: ribonuclease [Sphingomonas sp.]